MGDKAGWSFILKAGEMDDTGIRPVNVMSRMGAKRVVADQRSTSNIPDSLPGDNNYLNPQVDGCVFARPRPWRPLGCGSGTINVATHWGCFAGGVPADSAEIPQKGCANETPRVAVNYRPTRRITAMGRTAIGCLPSAPDPPGHFPLSMIAGPGLIPCAHV